jgi:CubicO group peptidase (beta-lactamase class C family)
MNLDAAFAYAERHGVEAMVVQQGADVTFERYAGGYQADKPHALYSGTKSFWGVAALAAEEDGLLTIDEPVARTLLSWDDGAKARVTLRMLLQLTAGIGFGGLGNTVPTFEKAAAVELKDEPGARFTYGGIPLQVFGAVLQRKLAPRGLSPNAYLRGRILDPIDVRVGAWRRLKDGTEPLPTGAFLAAREWLKFGVFVRDAGGLERCFVGSEANPRYGLAWWLSPIAHVPDLVYASGSAGQAMYVIRSRGAVVVKFGQSASYNHEAFLKRLL